MALKQTEISATHNYILAADISRFYGTLYTHAIPWALHGKAWSKANLRQPAYNASLGNKLDIAIRKGNDNQTIGIPVGPDSSRIISEIVAVSVDQRIREKLSLRGDGTLRNVDDWHIGFDSAGQAEDAIAIVAAACRDYELELNAEKTRAIYSSDLIQTIWPSTLRNLSGRVKVGDQAKSLEHFFIQAFAFAVSYEGQNVLDFAVKRTKGINVRRENWHLYETYLLKIVRANASTLPAIVQILVSYNSNGFPLRKERIAKLVHDLISKAAPNGHHAEIAWALFLAKALRIELQSTWVEAVGRLESSTCALLLLDLRNRGLIQGQIDTDNWEQSMNTEGLTSTMWMLAYEADLKGWLGSSTPNYVENHAYFRELKRRNVSFYDPERNVVHIRRSRPRAPSAAFQQYITHIRATEFDASAFLTFSMMG